MPIWLRWRNLVLKETTNTSLYETHKLLYGIHIVCLLVVATLNIFMVLSYLSFFSFSKPCRWAREKQSLISNTLAWEYYKSERLKDFIILPQILRPKPSFLDPTITSSFCQAGGTLDPPLCSLVRGGEPWWERPRPLWCLGAGSGLRRKPKERNRRRKPALFQSTVQAHCLLRNWVQGASRISKGIMSLKAKEKEKRGSSVLRISNVHPHIKSG